MYPTVALNCKHTISKLAQTNNVTVMWVPGHTGIQRNKEADLLANTGSAHEFYGPEPAQHCQSPNQLLRKV